MAQILTKVFTKYAGESRLYEFNFSEQPEFASQGQTITGPVVVDLISGSGLNLGVPSVSGARVQVRLSSGTPGTTYVLRCTISTSGGSTLICEGTLQVV